MPSVAASPAARSALARSLTDTAKEDCLAFQVERDVLAQLSFEHRAHCFKTTRTRPHAQVVHRARAILLPQNYGSIAGRFAVDQYFARIDRDRVGYIAIGDRDALQVDKSIDYQGLADGDL